MKVGDLVQLASQWADQSMGTGIIIAFKGSDPVVYWNDRFSEEVEYASQLRVVTPRKKEII
jgi:hypothetical protein